MPYYVIAKYTKMFTLTNLDVFYDSKFAHEEHKKRRDSASDDEQFWLCTIESLDELGEIEKTRSDK